MLPVPEEASVASFSSFFAAAMNSAAFDAGFYGLTTITSTLLTTSDTGAKSRAMS
jgi:hypothetical protein